MFCSSIMTNHTVQDLTVFDCFSLWIIWAAMLKSGSGFSPVFISFLNFQYLKRTLNGFVACFNFAEVQGMEECAEHLRRLAASSVLPPQYWLTLQCLLRHLARVCQASAANLLNARTLAEIFSPALFRQQATR